MNKYSFWAIPVCAGVISFNANAATLTFDSDTSTAGAQDGSGIWTNGLPDTNWWNGVANTNWNSATPDTAIIGAASGAAGTITVIDTQTVGGISFNVPGSGTYVLTNGQLNASGTAVFQMNTNARIESALGGGATVQVQGPGTLTLNGSNLLSGTLRVSNSTATVSGQFSQLGNISLSGTTPGVLNVQPGASIKVTSSLFLGDTATANNGTLNQSGGFVDYQGSTNSFRIAHWPTETSTYSMSGGLLLSLTNRMLNVGWDGNGILNMSGGTAMVYGIQIAGGDSQTHTGAGTLNLNGGRIDIGAGGLRTRTNAAVFNMGGGTVAASASWSSIAPLRLNATNGNTTFDAAVGTTMTFSGVLTGTGGFYKAGSGTMLLTTVSNSFSAGVTVGGGILAAGGDSANNQNDGALGNGPVTVVTNGQLRLGGNAGGIVNHFVRNPITLDGGTIFAIDGGQHLTNATLAIGTGGATLMARWGTKDLFLESPVSGTGPLTISNGGGGSGIPNVWFVNGNNSYAGTVTVASASAILGVGSPNTLSNATVNLLGNDAVTFGTVSGGTAVFGALVGPGSITLPTNVLSVGALNTSFTYDGSLLGSGSLTKRGSGTLTLAGGSTLAGKLTVEAGVLAFSAAGSAVNASDIRVNSGATFDVSAAGYAIPATQVLGGFGGMVTGVVTATDGARIVGGAIGAPGTLTLADSLLESSTYTNYFDLTNSLTVGAGVNDLLNINGTFEPLGATIAINPLAPLVSGGYRLINYGAMSGTNFNATILGNTTRDTWALDTTTFGQVNLNVSAGTPNTLLWLGANTADWDGGITNWLSFTTVQMDRFYDLDSVLFEDTGATVNVVTISGAVKPTAVTVDSASNYTFTGSGRINDSAGVPATLTKNGIGTLTIATTNGFTGGTTVNNGTVVRAGNGALGTGPVALAGPSVLVDLAGGTVVGAINGSGALVKASGGALTLTGAGSFSGPITISNGTALVIGSPGYLNPGAYAGTIANNGSLTFNGSTQAISGSISGTGTLTQAGALNSSVLTLSNTNTFTGVTTLFSGALTLASTNGPALIGPVVFDNNLSPDIYTTVNNQFGPGTVLVFTNDVGDHGRIELIGTTQTLAGIQTTYATQRGVIQNREFGPANTGTSLLILNGAGEYTFGGYLRNQNGVLGLSKTGSGTQTLAGTVVNYTGPTLVGAGRLVLSNTTIFASPITLSAGALLEGNYPTAGFANRKSLTTSSLAGTGTVNITSAGTLTLPGVVALNGQINVLAGSFGTDGTVANWAGNTAAVAVSTGAVFSIRANSIQIGTLTGSGDVVNNWNGHGATGDTLTVGADNGSGLYAGTIRGSQTAGTDGALDNGILNLRKIGSGIQTLSGTNTYAGTTTIGNGTLALDASGSLAGSPRIIVSSGATFDVSVLGNLPLANFQSLEGGGFVTGSVSTATGSRIIPGTASAVGTLTFGNNLNLTATTTNFFDLTGSDTTPGNGTNDLVNVGGLLEPSNAVVAINQLTPLANGTWRLFNYTGAKTTTFNTNVLGNVTRKSYALDETTPGQINLTVSGSFGNLRWNPLTSSNWDFAGTNWFDMTALTTNAFVTSDSVLFDDIGAYSNGVNLVTAVAPLSVTINSSSNYSITGAGKITGSTGLTKDGTGTLTLGGTANDYTGPVIISNGVLKAGTTSALGATNGVTTVLPNGALDLNGLNLGQEVVNIIGAGFGGNGTIINGGAAQTLALQYVKLLGDATVGGANRWDVRAGTAPYFDLNGFTLTKVGPGFVGFIGTSTTNAGDFVINSGSLGFHTSPTVVTGPGSIYVNPGAALDIYQSPTVSKTVVLNGGKLSVSLAGTIGPQIIINTNSTIDTSGGALGLTNVISGAGGLIKTNANTLNLTGASTYTGGTTVYGGELQIGNNTDSGSIVGIISNYANVYFYRTNAFTLTSPITGTGNVFLRTTGGMTIDSNALITIGGYFNVGEGVRAKLILTNGASVFASNTINIAQAGSAYLQIYSNTTMTTLNELLIGNNANNILYYGDVIQYGGNVSVLSTNTGEAGMRLGHWPGEVSFWRMLGGTLTVTNSANGTSALYLGIDGAGILDLQGGTVNVRQLFVDGRGNTGAVNGTNETLILSGGRLNIGSGGLTTAGGGDVYFGGGTLSAMTDWTSGAAGLNTQLTGTNGNTVLDSAGFTYRLAMTMTGTGGLTKVNSGTVALSAYNTYSGDTIVNGGTLVLSNTANSGASVIGTSKLTINTGATVRTYVNSFGFPNGNGPHNSIIINGGTLDQGNADSHLRDVTMTAGTISGTQFRPHWDITVNAAANPSIISSSLLLVSNITFVVADGAATNDLIVSGVVSSALGFNKRGPGTMTLEAVNTYVGPTIISNGTLVVNGSINTGAVTVISGATLGGTGTVNGAVTSAGSVAPGASAGTLTLSSDYTQNSSGSLNIEVGGPGTNDYLSVTGLATLDGALNVSLINGYTGSTGDSFLVFSSGSIAGGFASTNLAPLGAGLEWVVQNLGTIVILSITNSSLPPPTGYDAFALAITNSPDRAYQADPDGDGYANLLEYVTGGEPNLFDSAARMDGARVGGLLALKFNRTSNSVDTTIIVEGASSSTNSANWIGIATNIGGSWGSATNIAETGGPSLFNVTAYDTDPSTNRFLRLRVTRP